jgi:hypothetical protein
MKNQANITLGYPDSTIIKSITALDDTHLTSKTNFSTELIINHSQKNESNVKNFRLQ